MPLLLKLYLENYSKRSTGEKLDAAWKKMLEEKLSVMPIYKDKSGSYGIQNYIGQFISKVDGCFYSVMGLPLNTTRELLEQVLIARSSEMIK